MTTPFQAYVVRDFQEGLSRSDPISQSVVAFLQESLEGHGDVVFEIATYCTVVAKSERAPGDVLFEITINGGATHLFVRKLSSDVFVISDRG